MEHTELMVDEQNELKVHEQVIEAGLRTFVEVGNALLAIRDKRLYRDGHDTFEEYCKERWSMSRSYAHRTIEAAQAVSNLLPMGNIPQAERVARPLTRLTPEEQPIAWQRAVDTAPNGKVTAAHVQAVVKEYWSPPAPIRPAAEPDDYNFSDDANDYDWTDDENAEDSESTTSTPAHKPHVTNNSGNNEWYTPTEYIEAAREVLGCIELDPASSAEANKVVKAKTYYTINDDGLSYNWFGKVWMNPPYAAGIIDKFTEKLAQHVEMGDISEAIVLVNNATETAWFGALANCSNAVCFKQARVKYWQPDNPKTNAPLQGQAFLYFGPDIERFISIFRRFGWCATIQNMTSTDS